MTKTFIRLQKGADAGDAFLASSYADMAAYPPSDIGQKHGFVQFAPQEGESPEATAKRLMHAEESPIANVRAPAGCIALSEQEFLFFGWAAHINPPAAANRDRQSKRLNSSH